jgi:amino acid adenylation domain-containing protein
MSYEVTTATVIQRFVEIAECYPEKIAIKFRVKSEWQSYTYSQLLKEAKAVASYLSNVGVKNGDAVILLSLRSPSLCSNILGILWCGGQYVFIDPKDPVERQRFICEEVNAKFGLAVENDVLTHLDVSWINPFLVNDEGSVPDLTTDIHKPAYTMFTSGSTGIPKGVIIPHRAITRLVQNTNFISFSEKEVFLQLSALSFDASTLEIWGPLLNGGTCVLHFENEAITPTAIQESIVSQGVTTLWLTSSLYNTIISLQPEALKSIKQLLTGGEALSVSHIKQGLQLLPDAQLFNGYGPTENTTFTTVYPIPRHLPEDIKRIPIGKSISGTTCEIFNGDLEPITEKGIAGELIAFGDGLALGYLNRQELTSEKFIEITCADGVRRQGYRTGDLVSMNENDNIEFLGRIDQQVKVRGYRIELGEIESRLEEIASIRETAVLAKRDTLGDNRLVAYMVQSENCQLPNISEIRAQLQLNLPDFMLPTAWVFLEKMPLNSSGKLDRKALPDPEQKRPELSQAYLPAKTELESHLVECWKQILNLEQVGIRDRFFELGGTSILAIQFIARMGQELGEVIPIASFFAAHTIEGFIRVLEKNHSSVLKKSFPNHQFHEIKSRRRPPSHLKRIYDFDDDIAIIGFAGRFPGADDVDAFWQNLCDGVESVQFASDDQLRLEGVSESDIADSDYIRSIFCANDLDGFDSDFFGYQLREADLIDPQHRLFLELAWVALDSAGYADTQNYEGRIGVLGGIARDSYLQNFVSKHPDHQDDLSDFHIMVGNDKNFPATRIAYKLNLTGPAINVQTACSTSGVSLHLACQQLHLGECDIALVGGCRVISPIQAGYRHVEGGALSADGHLRAFDAQASGMVRGSGGSVLVIKKLKAAQSDGDCIRGIIKSTSINNDGDARVGFTAPGVDGQEEVILSALEKAKINPESIGYVEAHGTATALGDPIEVAALTNAYRHYTDKSGYCKIGSVKTNIGHLDAGSAATSAIKIMLAMEQGKIPASLHYQKPNPNLNIENSPFSVNACLSSWKIDDQARRRAGISSFGLGGTNFHAIFEQAPARELIKESNNCRPWNLITLSAKSQTSLNANLAGLVEYHRKHPEHSLNNLAFSLNSCRPGFNHRATLLCNGVVDLSEFDLLSAVRKINRDTVEPPVFFFPAEGQLSESEWTILLESEPQLYSYVNECCQLLNEEGSNASRENKTDFLLSLSASEQLLILEYALARLWIKWGVTPSAVYGCGVGKISSACITGALSLAASFKLLAAVSNENREQLTKILTEISTQSLDVPFLSATSGTLVNCDLMSSADFWLSSGKENHVSSTALNHLSQLNLSAFVEVGPGSALIDSLPETSRNETCEQAVASLPLLSSDPAKELTAAVGMLWSNGQSINWKSYYTGQQCQRVPLPTFRFQRRRHWLDLPSVGPKVFTLEAPSESELQHSEAAWSAYLEQHPNCNLLELAISDQTLREPYRSGIVVFNNSEAAKLLSGDNPQMTNRVHSQNDPASVVFMFPGGGAQYLQMGRGLYKRYAEFRSAIDEGLALFGSRTGYDLKRVWFAAEHEKDWAQLELQRPSVQLPAIFILEMALARLWMTWGVKPKALIGHSLGENCAACLSGVLNYEDTLGLIILRGQLFEKVETGGMLSVPLSVEELTPYMSAQLDVAIVNGPQQCTISGHRLLLDKVLKRLEKDGIEAQRIPIATAAHSQLLDPILAEFEAYLHNVDLQPPQIPMISNLTGDWLSDDDACDHTYWVKHLRNTVQFSAGLQTLTKQNRFYLEIGPGKALTSLVKSQFPKLSNAAIASLRHEREKVEDQVFFLNSLSRLWLIGASLDLSQINKDLPGTLLHLPLLPPGAVSQIKKDLPLPIEMSLAQPTLQTGSTVVMSRKELIANKLKAIIEDMSGMPSATIDSEIPFLNMGFDSLFLTQANMRFKKMFKVKITLRQVMSEAPTIDSLVEYIDKQLPEDALTDELNQQSQAPQQITSSTPSGSILTAGSLPNNLQQAIALQIQTSTALLSFLQGGTSVQQLDTTPVVPLVIAEERTASEVTDQLQSEGTAHGPFVPLQRTVNTEMSEQQQKYLEEFTRSYVQKTAASKELAVELRSNYADPRMVLGFKSQWKELTYTLAAERSKGSRVWDIDGNEYVDCMGGFGVIFFGHAPDFVLDAVRKQLETNIDYGPQSAACGRVAKLICEFTGMERVSFCNTGSEATLAAIRIARTVTGNDLIVTFQGDYHGIFDEVLVRAQDIGGQRRNQPVAPGIPASANQNVLMLDYDDPKSLQILRERAEEIAGVIVEPIQSRHPEVQPKEFLHQLREVTREIDVPLIFDEIITGFRLHPKGAQGWFDVEADIACYGKVVGGGFPIGVIAGQRRYMDALDGGAWQFGDDSFPEVGVTYFAGTFVRHPVALAATEAVLLKLKEGGPQLQLQLNKKTAIFAETVNRSYRQMGVPIELVYFGSAFVIRYHGNTDYEGLYWHHLRHYGAHHIWGKRPGFLTTAHTEEDMASLVDSFVQAAASMQKGGFLPQLNEAPEDIHPWLPMQIELWMAIKFGEAASTAYNEQVMFEINNALDPKVFELVMDKVTNRHPSLRAVVSEEEEGLQIRPYMRPQFSYEDLSHLSKELQSETLNNLATEHIDKPFDFKKGPLVRALLIKQEEDKHVLCVCASHLVCDGWSLEIVMEDIAGYYTGTTQARFIKRRGVPTLSELDKATKGQKESGDWKEAREYWQSIYQDNLPPNLDLPLDFPRPKVRTFAGGRRNYYLDTALIAPMRKFAKDRGCTSFILTLAIYQVMLNKLCDQDDIVVGIPAAGQPVIGMNDSVSHNVAFLPLRTRFKREQNFEEFLLNLRDNFMDAKEHQSFAYGEIISDLPISRDPSRLPLVTASFNMDMAYNPLNFDNVMARFLPAPRSFSKYDLQFSLTDEGASILIEVDSNSDIVTGETIDRWVTHYQCLMNEVLSKPDRPIGEIPMLSSEDQEKMLTDWNATSVDYEPDNLTLHCLLEQAVDKHHDKVAIIEGDLKITFQELDQRANQLAHYLRAQGVSSNDLVGVMLDRSLEMIIALNAIIKAGAAYLPLDTEYPLDRTSYILEESKSKIVLIQKDYKEKLPETAQYLCLDSDWHEISDNPTSRLDNLTQPDHLAYVIYTSGSTGRPKGVMNEHRGICNRLLWMQDVLPLTDKDRVLQKTPYTFDVSVWELFLPQITGTTLVMAKSDGHKETDYLIDIIRNQKITYLHFVPSMLHLFLQDPEVKKCTSLTRVICSGEALNADLRDNFFMSFPDTELHNLYGPTEAAVDVTHWSCLASNKEQVVPIGKPVANTQIYILDNAMNPVPVGVPGELHIGGIQVARGYLNRPDLTADKFVDDPFSNTPNAKLYKTGDLTRYRTDGNIEYLGRNDFQVKVRGLRIELGEIENVLSQAAGVDRCVVLAREDKTNDQRLVAYIIPEDHDDFDTISLRKYLRSQIPGYMIPQYFELVEKFPLTSSGKIDRNKLPVPNQIEVYDQSSQYQEPETEAERLLAEIWKELIGVEKIGVHDNFFDVGGHSLLSMQLIAMARKSMGVQITPRMVLLSTLGQIAQECSMDSL